MKRTFTCAALAATLCHGASADEARDWNLPSIQTPAISWTACPESLVGQDASRLGDRLRCGEMTLPRDHHDPAAGSIQVALVRVAASDPARRQGAIFFNPGGPGVTPMKTLPTISLYWANAIDGHPVHGTKKQLAEQFDLVGVVPRGLPGGTFFRCESEAIVTRNDDIVADPSPANVQKMESYMHAIADACQADPLHRFINTEQVVYDMEAARKALGEPRLNYLGYSYGTWLGTWYAASFPERVGRMVLDSSMDWTADWDTNVTRYMGAEQSQFERLVGEPAANDRFRYVLGADVATVVAQIEPLGSRVRAAWAGTWESPESLRAAMDVATWLRLEPGLGLERLATRLLTNRFHSDDAVDSAVRRAAVDRVWALYLPASEAKPMRLPTNDSVYAAVSCNDMPIPGDVSHHKARIASLARSYPAANGVGLQYHCAYWNGPRAMRPPLSRIGAAGRILMVHAEHDPATPLRSGNTAWESTPGAYLLVAAGSGLHGVFGFTGSACVEDSVGRYLLSGVLPAGRTRRCSASPVQDHASIGFHHPLDTAMLRSRLSSIHASFGH